MLVSNLCNYMNIPPVRALHTIDAEGRPMGRLASETATILRGKNKPTYVPHIDAGDSVVVKNFDKVKFTGQKLSQKVYHHHSGFPGGLKTRQLSAVIKTKPQEVLRHAVKNMLPPTRLRGGMLKRLRFEA